ncbi:unnamed protein product [Vitrella brassicaformis CCMP3155]|uniref:NAD(P)-binding domain-containing protein n=1 Tax=Vitrella brassicaformis (strain CCMP3155) TaxID=1169540 RepID=A0A0G4GS61_VITBC|nr:unnamed protein product [Vitrella brassicaformis CCMP3155]|eukprot:CEM33438.1 unnamed protein product [Vitrella brassicaformis CCMP3155]
MADSKTSAVVCGEVGGIGRLLALQLAENPSYSVRAFLHQSESTQPLGHDALDTLKQKADVAVVDLLSDSVPQQLVDGIKTADVLLVSPDDGSEMKSRRLRTEERIRAMQTGKAQAADALLLEEELEEEIEDQIQWDSLTSSILSQASSLKSVVATVPQSGETGYKGGLLKMLKRKQDPLDQVISKYVSSKPSIRPVIVRYGRLIGGLGEPTPFLSGPLRAPQLDEFYVKQGVRMSRTVSLGKVTGETVTRRDQVAKAAVQCLENLDSVEYGGDGEAALDVTVFSLEDPTPPSDYVWQEQLSRLDDKYACDVLVMDLAKAERPEAFLAWVREEWGREAIGAATASRRSVGARPTAIERKADSVAMVWEYLDESFNAFTEGYLKFALEGAGTGSPTLRVSRYDGDDRPLLKPLFGESEIINLFLEGLTKTAFPRNFIARKGDKAEEKKGAVGAGTKQGTRRRKVKRRRK